MSKNLRIAFFGTPDFATASLKRLVKDGWNIVAVITAPDKPSGRGQQLSISDVKHYAQKVNLPIYQPEKLKAADFVELYRSLNIDLAVVVAFRMMPEVIWAMPRIGTINLHGSLLPNYRGAAPINWAIIHGEKETGVTTFFINQEIDKGDILFQQTCKIEDSDDFGSLYSKLKEIGASLLIETLSKIEHGDYRSSPQEFKPTDKSAPKIDKDILEIKDYTSSGSIHNLVRGLIPVYKPFFIYKDKKYIVKKGQYSLEKVHEKPCELITDNSSFLKLACNNGYYWVTEIQAEGKKPMDIKSFLNGNQL
jgi:methionyl-tRNA formyltransferase